MPAKSRAESPGGGQRFPTALFFLSDEGFGHIVRQEAIIKELIRRVPNVKVLAQTKKKMAVLREKFGDRVHYLERYNNIHTTKTPEGSLNVTETLATFQRYPETSARWLTEMRAANLEFDFAISDFVPEAFAYCRELGRPCFGVAHFTWDWFLKEISSSSREACAVMEDYVRQATRLYFPPFTEPAILDQYRALTKDVSFIINEFSPVKLNCKPGDYDFKCLIMDNGTHTLSEVIEKSIDELSRFRAVQFYVCVDNLGAGARAKIESSANIQPVSGLRETHSHIPLVDFVLARGGFNTLTECLITRTPALLVEEGENPEISGNIRMLTERGLAARFAIADFNGSLGARLEKFISQELSVVRDNLLRTRFENSGPSEIVEDILLTAWK